METANRTPCASCQRLQAQVQALQAEIVELREQLASARKDSSTSSKPPSSDIVKVTISCGELSKIIGKVSEALDGPYEELLLLLPYQPVVNADETGHKDNGDRWWTWCFRAELFTVYHIDAYRSADVLMDVLG